MTRTESQQLVRDAAWRFSCADKMARLTPEDLSALGLAINGLLGWGVAKPARVRHIATIERVILKMDSESLA